jgi:hypothetical protein
MLEAVELVNVHGGVQAPGTLTLAYGQPPHLVKIKVKIKKKKGIKLSLQ